MLPPLINSRLSENPDVVILTAHYDDTSSFAKSEVGGPEKVLDCLNTQIEVFDRTFKKSTVYLIKTAHKDFGKLNGRSPEDVFSLIRSGYREVLENKSFPILIGGEHSVSIGALAALSEKVDPATVTVVQVDAHLDTRDDDSDYSEYPTKFAHSAVMRRAHEMGFPLVQVGIRTYAEDEYAYVQNNPETITVFEWGPKVPSILDIISAIRTEKVYFTVDIDGIDPAHLPGTGTPVPGGLEWYYFFDLMNALFTEKNVIGADVVEVMPQTDSVVTEFGAAQIIYTMCGHIHSRS